MQARHIQELLRCMWKLLAEIVRLCIRKIVRLSRWERGMVVPRDDFWDFLMAHKGIRPVVSVEICV